MCFAEHFGSCSFGLFTHFISFGAFAIQEPVESSEDGDVGEEMHDAVIKAVEELVRQLGSSTHLKHGTLYLFSLLLCYYFIG